MFRHHSVPANIHTSDYYQKAKVLKRRGRWSFRVWGLLFGAAIVLALILMGPR